MTHLQAERVNFSAPDDISAFPYPPSSRDAVNSGVDMGYLVWYTNSTLRDTQMPEDFTLHSKYTGDESHGVKVVSQRPRSKK